MRNDGNTETKAAKTANLQQRQHFEQWQRQHEKAVSISGYLVSVAVFPMFYINKRVIERGVIGIYRGADGKRKQQAARPGWIKTGIETCWMQRVSSFLGGVELEEACVKLTGDEKPDFRVRDYKHDAFAICPLTKCDCMTTCMWMRPTGFGEPKCAVMVIADELVNIYAESRKRGVVNE